MRAVLSVGAILIVFAATAFITAQTRTEPKVNEASSKEGPMPSQGKKVASTKSAIVQSSRAVLSNLQLEIETRPFQQKMRFKRFLDTISEQLQKNDREVTFNVDKDAFATELGADAPDLFDMEVVYTGNRKHTTVMHLLSQVIKQIANSSARFIVRAGQVDIVPVDLASKQHMLNQTVRAEFKDQRLDMVLEELTDLTGVSIVIDTRAKQKAQTTLTARFNDDVALQDVVRMLTEMAELKIVYLVTGMYITTPDHAITMQKELKALYEPAPAPMAPAIPGGGISPLDPFRDESPSPLAPPLPPEPRGKRVEAGA